MQEADKEEVKNGRDAIVARLKSRYPDDEYSDDNALYERIVGDYDEYDRRINEYGEREKALAEMFSKDPRSASFFQSMRAGEDPAVSLVRLFGQDIRDAIDDPEKQEEIAQANKEFVERVAKSQQLEEEYLANLEKSTSDIGALQEEMSLSDADMDNALKYIMTIVTDGVQGKFYPDTIKMALKAINYDKDIEEAAHTAEVKGRNAKITETLRKKEHGDGMAKLDGGAVPAGQERRRAMSVFDLADMAK